LWNPGQRWSFVKHQAISIEEQRVAGRQLKSLKLQRCGVSRLVKRGLNLQLTGRLAAFRSLCTGRPSWRNEASRCRLQVAIEKLEGLLPRGRRKVVRRVRVDRLKILRPVEQRVDRPSGCD
jgi:hypothetical protein